MKAGSSSTMFDSAMFSVRCCPRTGWSCRMFRRYTKRSVSPHGGPQHELIITDSFITTICTLCYLPAIVGLWRHADCPAQSHKGLGANFGIMGNTQLECPRPLCTCHAFQALTADWRHTGVADVVKLGSVSSEVGCTFSGSSVGQISRHTRPQAHLCHICLCCNVSCLHRRSASI